jgi:hypothetical protein
MFESFRDCITSLDAAGMTDAERIDLIRELEQLKCAAGAGQAELAAALGEGRGAAAQVALARRESPHRGQQHLSLARVLPELPCTRAAFRAGRITEWRVTTIARETACLSLEDRRAVDRAIAGDADALESYSDRVVLGELRKLAARLDPAAVAERRRRAESERRVTVRPAPDTMAFLTVLTPVAQAVGCWAALRTAADAEIAAGDTRTRDQLMADILVSRITGAPVVDGQPVVPARIGLVMTDAALLGGAQDTAHLTGFGPIPAELARSLAADHLDSGSRLWLRRLYTSPERDELVAMDSHQRLFRGQLREFIELRDQFCRSPWCSAPIRHGDHVVRAADGGETTAADGQGLCATCNYVKEEPGWRARPSPAGRGHAVEITTPTGHTYTSHAPPLVALRAGVYRQVDDGLWTLVA